MKNTRKAFAALLAVVMTAVLLTACNKDQGADTSSKVASQPVRTVKLGTTTSVDDSGLIDYLRPYIKDEINIEMDVVAKGSGQVMTMAKNGDFDLIIAHSPADEQTFVDEGYGIERTSFMYNYFVIVGPKDDPAKIKGMEIAEDAFKAIVNTKAKFASRGDESGTHKKELKIWSAVELDPASLSTDIYLSTGSGMGNTLTKASEMGAYCLTDKATYLSMKDKLNLDLLLEGGASLKNTYSVILVNPEKFSNLQKDAAKELKEFLISDKTKTDLIGKFGMDQYGVALFYVDGM